MVKKITTRYEVADSEWESFNSYLNKNGYHIEIKTVDGTGIYKGASFFHQNKVADVFSPEGKGCRVLEVRDSDLAKLIDSHFEFD